MHASQRDTYSALSQCPCCALLLCRPLREQWQQSWESKVLTAQKPTAQCVQQGLPWHRVRAWLFVGHPTTDQLHHCAPREHCSTCRQPSHLHIDLSCYLVSVFLPRKLMAAILRALHCLSEHLKAFSLSRSGEGLHCTCQSRGGMLYAWLCQLFLPPFQYAAGQDVFLYWNNNGCDPGRLCSPNKARKWNQSCKKGKYICQYFLFFPPTNLMHPFSV